MGYLQAREMATHAPLETALSWHLSANHYPPIPSVMIPACVAAIEAANDDDYTREIALPEGVEYQDETSAPAWALIEHAHLDAFLGLDEEE